MIVLDGRAMNNKAGLHLHLKEQFGFASHYGGNLDALWDCLEDFLGNCSGATYSLTIIWHEFDYTRNAVGNYTDKVIQIFKDLKNEYEGIYLHIL